MSRLYDYDDDDDNDEIIRVSGRTNNKRVIDYAEEDDDDNDDQTIGREEGWISKVVEAAVDIHDSVNQIMKIDDADADADADAGAENISAKQSLLVIEGYSKYHNSTEKLLSKEKLLVADIYEKYPTSTLFLEARLKVIVAIQRLLPCYTNLYLKFLRDRNGFSQYMRHQEKNGTKWADLHAKSTNCVSFKRYTQMIRDKTKS